MRQFTIRQKLLGVIAAVLLAFSSLSVFQLVRMSSITHGLEVLYQKDFANSYYVSELDGLLTRVDINILRMIAIGDPALIKTWKAENIERFGKADQLIANLVANIDDQGKPLAADLQSAYTKMRAGMNHQIERIEANDVQGGAEVNRLEVKDNANAVFTTLDKIAKRIKQGAGVQLQEQLATGTTTRTVALAALVLISVLGLAGSLLLVRNLLRQLGGEPDYAANVAREVAQGNLMVDIATRAEDKDSLLAAMSEMRNSLRDIVSRVRQGSDSISTGAREIASGNVDLSHRTEEQASNLQQTAASMEQLNTTVRSSADTALQATQLANSASAAAQQGGEVVRRVVDTMGEISGSSRKIADIISVIDGIAFQTNILALNAAVEAARAGEQGRGFAVVASEVRSLAGRSADAAKEIKALISASVEKVETGSQLVGDAGTSMENIVQQVQRVADLIAEISAATSEQTQGIGQINAAVTQLDQTTQQNAALVEESSAAADNLSQQAQRLTEIVRTFRIDQDAGSFHGAASAPAPSPVRKPLAASAALRAAPAASRPALSRPTPAAASHDQWAAH
ncbi:methyl-accepting chemotaxis protein [Acidovorax sp. SUPP2825]|uniref:methyl-accepting chemotaxis protein n=1 Tax=Acidovorax sp. SUPP2825 TaxID=2920879 RepID=UPI0023DE626A|nr:methyl-accepting chemotaxis protein [Acidovorax sp. SUPP2825]GKS97520.1 MCP four helix bundle domain-containing protein [Acidovorax sp. SUPP2825]